MCLHIKNYVFTLITERKKLFMKDKPKNSSKFQKIFDFPKSKISILYIS